MSAYELSVLDWVQTHLRSAFGDAIMPAVSALGNAGVVWIVLALGLLLWRRTRRTGAALACALLVDVLLCNLTLKPLVARERPFALRQIELLVARPTDASFPSGHTAASFAACSALGFAGSRLWIPALLLACLIAFSRLYLYVHFPTDVLGGALLGVLAGYLGVRLARWGETGLTRLREHSGRDR